MHALTCMNVYIGHSAHIVHLIFSSKFLRLISEKRTAVSKEIFLCEYDLYAIIFILLPHTSLVISKTTV